MIAGLVPGTWLTIANYAMAFALCLFAGRKDGRTGLLWLALAAVMLALTLNRIFDIEAMVAEAGRALAKEDGLYHSRRLYQKVAVKALLAGLAVLLVVVWKQLRTLEWPFRISAIGLISLCFFIVARAISYHNVDRFLNRDLGVIKLNGVIENGVVLCIAFGAALALRARAAPI